MQAPRPNNANIGTWLAVYMTLFGGSLVDPAGKKITANCPACVAALTWEANYYKKIGAANIDKFTSGFGAELVALVQERCFYHLEAPVERVTGWDTPYPHAYEWAYFPGPKRMKRALDKVMAE